MRLVNLSELLVGAGTLTWWRLPDTAHPSRTVPSDAPPAHNQDLRLWQAAGGRDSDHWPRRWSLGAVDLPGPADVETLERALTEFVRRHDTLRSVFVPTAPAGSSDDTGGGDGDDAAPPPLGVQRRLLPAADATLVSGDLGRFTDGNAALEALVRLADATTNPWGWPPCFFASLTGEERTTVFMGADLVNADLHSFGVAAAEIHELYTAHAAGRPPRLDTPGSHVDLARAERARDATPCDAALRYWEDFAHAAGGRLPTFPLDLGVPEDADVPLTRENLPLLDAAETAALESWCWENGGMFLSALLAAAGLTVADLAGARSFHTIVPVQTRPDSRAPAVGWFVTGVPIGFPVPPGAGMSAVVRSAQTAFLRARRHLDVPIERVLRALPPHIEQGGASWFSYSDFRGIPAADSTVLHTTRVASNDRRGGSGDTWITRTDGGLTLHARFPEVPTARRAVRAYADGIAARLRAVAEPAAVAAD